MNQSDAFIDADGVDSQRRSEEDLMEDIFVFLSYSEAAQQTQCEHACMCVCVFCVCVVVYTCRQNKK